MLKPPVVANCPGRVVPENVIWLKVLPRSCASPLLGVTKSMVAPAFRVIGLPKLSAVVSPTPPALLVLMTELPAPRVRLPNVSAVAVVLMFGRKIKLPPSSVTGEVVGIRIGVPEMPEAELSSRNESPGPTVTAEVALENAVAGPRRP